MDVTTPAADYPNIFRTYIVQGAQQTLAQVRQCEDLGRQPAMRDTILHMLDFILTHPATVAQGLEILERLAPQMEQAGYWESWMPYLQQGLHQSQTFGDTHAEARLYLWLGILYQQQSQLAQAYRHLQQSATGFATVGDGTNQAKALNRLAYVARLQRSYTASQHAVDQALTLLANDDAERSFSYFVKGVIAFDHGDWANAVEQFQRSIQWIEPLGDQRTLARRLRNLGPALRALGRYDEAIACYTRAIALFEAVYDPVQQAVTRMNLGVVYLMCAQPTQALAQFTQAEPVFREVHDRLHLAMLQTNQGIAYRLLQDWAQAEQYQKASIEHFQQLGNLAAQVNALDELGLVYLDQQALDKAQATFQEATGLLEQMQLDPAYPALCTTIQEHQQALSVLLAQA